MSGQHLDRKKCIQAFETTFFAGIYSLEKKQIYQITI